MRIRPLLPVALVVGCSPPDAPSAGPPVPVPMSPASDGDLDHDGWSHRPLVVLGPGTDDPRVVAMRRRVNEARVGFEDRDMVWRFVDTSASGDIATRDRFEVSQGAFGVRLVGKDGGVKLTSDEPVELDELFELIDGMPMRQREMEASSSTAPIRYPGGPDGMATDRGAARSGQRGAGARAARGSGLLCL